MLKAFPGKEAAVPGHRHCPGLGESAQDEDFHLHRQHRGIVPQQGQGLHPAQNPPSALGFPSQRIPPWQLSPSSSPARHPKYSPVERPSFPGVHPWRDFLFGYQVLEETQAALYWIFPLGAPPLAHRECWQGVMKKGRSPPVSGKCESLGGAFASCVDIWASAGSGEMLWLNSKISVDEFTSSNTSPAFLASCIYIPSLVAATRLD